MPGEAVIVGDQFERGDGVPVEVVAARQVGKREFIVAVPFEVMKLLERPTERFGRSWPLHADDPAASRNVLDPTGPEDRWLEHGFHHFTVPDADVPADGVGRFEVPVSKDFQPSRMVSASE